MEVETQDEEEEEELTDINIEEGDLINLPDILFDENRDYLIKYNGIVSFTKCFYFQCFY